MKKEKTITPINYSVLDYGAIGDGKTNNTNAIQKAILDCSNSGGGKVIVPPGEYISGPIEIYSHITLHIEAGATIKAIPILDAFPLEQSKLSMESDRSGLITARNANTVTITGRGVIDGNGLAFMDTTQNKVGNDYDKRYTRQGEDFMNAKYGTHDGPLSHGDRPGNLIRFYNCKNVLIEGVTIQNSPTWTTHINHCEGVDILGVKINSLGSDRRIGNDDGIDLSSSKNVHIANCDIQTGDDCIALFGSKNVTVSNCTLSSRSSGIRVGFDDGDTQDCTFNNLVIHSNRGIVVNVRGEGSVKNVLFSNIILHTAIITGHWWGKGEAFQVSAMPWNPNAKGLGTIQNVVFRNIHAESEAGIILYGCPESRIKNVIIDGLHLVIKKGKYQESYGGNFDLRSTNDMSTALFKHDIPGLYAGHIEGLLIMGMNLSFEEDLPDFYTYGIECEQFTDFSLHHFRMTTAGWNKSPAIYLHDGKGISIVGQIPTNIIERCSL